MCQMSADFTLLYCRFLGNGGIMHKTLIVVDLQNDYISGSLGSKEAQNIIPNIVRKIQKCKEEGYEIIFTRDTHKKDYLETNEGCHLPIEHCIKGTLGWEIPKEIDVSSATHINKKTFGYMGLKDFGFEDVELIGLCTDTSVVSNALLIKAAFPEIRVAVDSSCCAGVSHESHEAALMTMRMCQIEVI